MATTKATTLAHTLGGISSDISTAEINRLDGVTGDIQTQITALDTAKAPKASPIFTGTITAPIIKPPSSTNLVLKEDNGTTSALTVFVDGKVGIGTHFKLITEGTFTNLGINDGDAGTVYSHPSSMAGVFVLHTTSGSGGQGTAFIYIEGSSEAIRYVGSVGMEVRLHEATGTSIAFKSTSGAGKNWNYALYGLQTDTTYT
jgi:hypothetical protein